jgi:hypothetical protein
VECLGKAAANAGAPASNKDRVAANLHVVSPRCGS